MKRFLPIILALFLTGCGATATTDVSATEAVQTAEKQDGNVSLRVTGSEADQAMLAQMAESFKEKYASEANIEITVEVLGEADCKNVLLADVLNAPDVFAFADDQLISLAASGVLKQVDNADAIKAANLAEAVSAASVGIDCMHSQ